MSNHPKAIKPKPGQESVWDYPRPPALEKVNKTLVVEFAGRIIAETNRGFRVLETSHPPVYYFPLEDVDTDILTESSLRTGCEWKGTGKYYHLQLNEKYSENAAWYYDKPKKRFREIKNYIAFYPDRVDACYVNGERITPQPGGFYGGWITQDIVGPFKGIDGSFGW
jgi:uncharacterized protein (DUF427 family)